MSNEVEHLYPQEGFQDAFLKSSADIVIGGGSAGAGKTFISLMAPLADYENPEFATVVFRRTYAQIKNIGGLWDESKKLYPKIDGKPNETDLHWTFPSGSVIKFSHLQHEKNIYDHQGAQYPLIIFDELTHFTPGMFWYLQSRNRSTCGVIPRTLATCNPDPDSFVAKLIEWWIDQETGYPIPERSGVVRFFIRDKDSMIWGDSKKEVLEKAQYLLEMFPADINPNDLIKSITFISGSIYQNKKLLEVNPGYLANLLSQDDATRDRLLGGNWKIRQDNTSLFDFNAIKDVFSNYLKSRSTSYYITCDAARFGRDLCVIMAWSGWEVMQIEVISKSDVYEIIKAIEYARQRWKVSKTNTIVDQDGVGASTVAKGGYTGFSGGAKALKVEGFAENFENFKTQCYYVLAEKINTNEVRINVDNETCIVNGVRSSKVKFGAKIIDITELIRDDLRAIKRAPDDNDKKKRINKKDEQKTILGRSPDFADTLMMRAAFEFRPKSIYL